MNFKIVLLTLLTMAQGCIKDSGKKGDFRANVQVAKTITAEATDIPDQYFEIELDKEKEKLKEVILRSSHKDEVKEQAIAYIDNFDYSQIKNMKDFMDIFLTGLMRILPDGLKETLDIAVDSTIIAANSLKQKILKEVIRKTAVQKSISEADIKSVIAEAVQESGYWQDGNVEEIIARVNEEILNEPEIKDALIQKAVKLTMDGCVDPDLSRIATDQTLTLCDGTQATGTLILPTQCDAAGQTDCLAQGDFKTINSATCINPDLSKIPTTETVILCDGSTATGTYSIPSECSVAGQSGCIATPKFPVMDLSSTEITTTSDLNDDDFLSLITASTTFQYWDKTGTRYTATGDDSITAGVIKSQANIFGVNGGVERPKHPTGLSIASPEANQLVISWDDVGANSYMLVERESNSVDLNPVDGTSYSLGTVGVNKVVYLGTSTSFAQNSGITQGNVYHYALYTVDAYNNYSNPTIASKTAASCNGLSGGSWVFVPGNTDYGTDDFCIMKYEAKNVSSAPESNAAGAPWVSINQNDARTECQSIGAGYDLISNAQWMTVATNIAAVGSNWSGGSPGNGYLPQGHADNSPGSACAASTNDLEAFVEGSCTPLTLGGDADNQRRTNTLSTGEVIWDLAGNVWEWTSASGLTNKPFELANWKQYSDNDFNYGSSSIQENELIPQIAIDNNWDSTEGIGQIYPGTNDFGGSLLRGANWGNPASSGVFAALLNHGPTDTPTSIGFRCVAAAP